MATKTRPCEICMKPIDPERCEANPQTRLCREHAEKIVKYGGEFKLITRQERTSKQGSLKLNYGGVSGRLIRNTAAIERLKDEYEMEREQKNG
jgi:hypothetical protein